MPISYSTVDVQCDQVQSRCIYAHASRYFCSTAHFFTILCSTAHFFRSFVRSFVFCCTFIVHRSLLGPFVGPFARPLILPCVLSLIDPFHSFIRFPPQGDEEGARGFAGGRQGLRRAARIVQGIPQPQARPLHPAPQKPVQKPRPVACLGRQRSWRRRYRIREWRPGG